MVEKAEGGKDWPIQRHWQHWVHTRQINVREKRRGNQDLTIQKHSQHWAHNTHGASCSVSLSFRTVVLSL